MLGFMADRRALAVSASCITAGILAFLTATYPSWKVAVGGLSPWVSASKPDNAPAKLAETANPTTPQPAMRAPAPEAAKALAPDSTPVAKPEGPSFDIVRVEPTGESVIAARAKPGDDIVLLDQGRPIAHAKADASGQVAFLPPTFAPGEHSLMLSVGEPNAPDSLSSQSVAVSVPDLPSTAPMVALIQPDQPAKVLSGEVAGSNAPAVGNADPSVKAPDPATMAISTIEVEDAGSFYATGKAAPGSHCRVYLNGSFIATVAVGKDGAWSLKIKRGMKPGHYVVRADQVESPEGQVQARAEVPFDYPTRAVKAVSLLGPKAQTLAGSTDSSSPAANGQPPIAAAGLVATNASADVALALVTQPATLQTSGAVAAPHAGDLSPTIVAQLLTTKVIRGDSLWRISRKILGHGERYTQIYAANTAQIRDPRLIYPGQIFVMPQTAH